MRLRDVVAVAAGVLALGAPATAIGSTLIGTYGQGDTQGVDSDQTATNGSGGAEYAGPGPVKFISGNSTPALSQTSTNIEVEGALIGGGDGTLIGDGNQNSKQAINSEQAAKKGTQVSTNAEFSTQLIGLTTAGDTIIGTPTQTNDQGTNSLQDAASRPGAVTTFIGGPTNKGPLTETSTNVLLSCEAVIGGPGC
jgi:hypothetical protein